MAANYVYLTFTLARGRDAFEGFVRHLNQVAAPAIEKTGGLLIGIFQGQLGFASTEAVVVLRATDDGRVEDLATVPSVVTMQRELLTPTMRPKDGATFKRGGIYVHRWFVVDAERVADFIALSNQAWADFERSYDTEIFGLFTAQPSPSDARDGAGRLLLLTWYASHGVWETSRELTRDCASLFAKRHLLTRSTTGRSSLLI